jgi:hypothetical protein
VNGIKFGRIPVLNGATSGIAAALIAEPRRRDERRCVFVGWVLVIIIVVVVLAVIGLLSLLRGRA